MCCRTLRLCLSYTFAVFACLAIAACCFIRTSQADLPVISNAKAIENAQQSLPEFRGVKLAWDGAYRVGSPTVMSISFYSRTEFNGILHVYVKDSDGDTIQHGPLYWRSRSTNGETIYPLTIQAPAKGFTLKIQLKIIPLGTEEMEQRQVERSSFEDFPISAEWTWNSDPALALSSVREVWMELGNSLKLKNVLSLGVHDERNQPAIVVSNFRNNDFDPAFFAGVHGVTLNTLMYPPVGHPGLENLDTYTLEKWVRQGGNLFLNFKENQESQPERRAAFDESWNKFLGGQVTTQRVPHSQFSVWETFLNTDEQLRINEELRRNPPLIPVISNLKGKVLLSNGDTPLVIEHQLGLGRVVTCLVDLNAEPWLQWRKRDELLQRLIPWHIATEAEAKFASSSSSLRLGYDDLAGQFVTALGTFQSVKLIPFWILMSAALGFGLVWYFLQSVLLKSWSAAARLVAAALVVAGATLAFAMLTGGGSAKESRLLANTAQVVDYNAMQGEYQGQSWISLLSSNSRQVDLQVDPRKLAAAKPDRTRGETQQLAWLGMPGKGWGGLDAPLANWTQASEPYHLEPHAAKVNNLTLSPDLTKSFHERWSLPTLPQQTTPLVSYRAESLPRGKLKSELPFALHDAILLYDTWGVELGTIQPGQVIDLDQIRGRVASAATIITGKRAQPTAPVQSYNRAGTDVREILKLMLLHRAAGGTRYTGLFSHAWPLLDQSASLTPNQALILGSGAAPVKWKIGTAGEKLEPLEPASEVCLYRLWMPVISSDQAAENASEPTIIRLPK